ncbi:MAG: hypothetical protein IJH67_00110 [Thermoguttaceae bacterium]|nr:hypothetical protein [Thermoguttaceae bacterium]
MEFANGERNYAFAGTANKTLRSELNKTTQLFSLSERFAASADFVFFVAFVAKKDAGASCTKMILTVYYE